VHSRRLTGQELIFERYEETFIRDEQTGSIWDGIEGRAVNGPLIGQQLDRVRSTGSFWFGWKDFYPETRVYGELRSEPVPPQDDSGSSGIIPR
jgi:hypothetical protein